VTPGGRRGAAVALWAIAVAAAGGAGARLTSGAKPVTHTVTVDGSRFEPARLTAHVGDTIVWVNKDLIPHTATAKGGRFDSKAIAAGASWRFKATAKGAVDYGCLFHPTMTGRLEVD
jgi:plastocyanin